MRIDVGQVRRAHAVPSVADLLEHPKLVQDLSAELAQSLLVQSPAVPMPAALERRLLSPDHAAAYLGLGSRWAVYRLVKAGEIPAVATGPLDVVVGYE